MIDDLLGWLIESTLATSAAILAVLALRPALRRVFGVGVCYPLWLLVPATGLATLWPAPVREVFIVAQSQVALNSAVGMPATQVVSGLWLAIALAWAVGAVFVGAVAWHRQRAFLRRLGALTRRTDGLLQAQAIIGLPAVVGWLPRIVVPADFDTRYRDDERRLILAHERVHVRRGDLAVLALLVAFRSVYWFNPLAWWATERARRDQELACDASVIARYPGARRVYGEAMVKISLGHNPAPLACHWTGAHPLKERIRMLKQTTPTSRRMLAASLTLALLTVGGGYVAWAAQPPQTQVKAAPGKSAAQASRAQAASAKPGYKSITAKFGSMPLRAAARRVADMGGVRLANPDALSATRSATLEFDHVDVRTALRIVANEDGKDVRFDGGLATFVALPAAAAKAPVATAKKRNAAAQGIVLTPPRYPADAAAQRKRGTVVVLVDVTADGRVANVVVEKSTSPGIFDQVTLEAVKQWKFTPSMKNGKPVPGRVRVPITFVMDDEAAPAPTSARAA